MNRKFLGIMLCSLGVLAGFAAPSLTITTLNKKVLKQNILLYLQSEPGVTNEQTCTIFTDDVEVAEDGVKSTRQMLHAVTDDAQQAELWSYWPAQFPRGYDFIIANSGKKTVLAYAMGSKIVFVDGFFKNTRADSFYQRNVHKEEVDVCALFGAQSFDGSENALTLNLHLTRVYFENGWHIEIQGKENRLFSIKREHEKWVAE